MQSTPPLSHTDSPLLSHKFTLPDSNSDSLGCLLEELERPLKLPLPLQRVADVIVQLGVVSVDAQTGCEDGVLVPPVLVTSVRLQTVYQYQGDVHGVQDAPTPAVDRGYTVRGYLEELNLPLIGVCPLSLSCGGNIYLGNGRINGKFQHPFSDVPEMS